MATQSKKPAAKAKKTTASKAKTPAKRATKKTATTKVKKLTTKKSSTKDTITPYALSKNEEYMNDAQQKHFINILINWKKEIMEGVDLTVNHMKQEAANFPDHNDRASQEEEFSLELRTRDRERKLLKKIEETLERIHENDFGFCDECGIEIGVRRLEARPIATLCIDCKEIAETKEKQENG